MKIGVFCSANNNIDADFFEQTRELGKWCADNGHAVVFCGHDAGLMHAVSIAAKENGGRVIGVVPRKIEEMGRLTPFLDEHIPTQDLTDRKQIMMDISDAFIILPGGIGTLDELFTVCSNVTLGYHHKPIIVYNMKGFWSSLVALLDSLERQGMMRCPWREIIHFADSLEDIQRILRN
jgi:uncharacterized protein (TIGR00730 family)